MFLRINLMFVVKVCYSCTSPLNFPSSPDSILISSLIPQLTSHFPASPASTVRWVSGVWSLDQVCRKCFFRQSISRVSVRPSLSRCSTTLEKTDIVRLEKKKLPTRKVSQAVSVA